MSEALSEGLSLPIDRKGADESQRVASFAGYIRSVYEGKGIPYSMPQAELQEELERGRGAPAEYSFSMARSLFKKIKKEERPLFLKAIATLVENPEIPQYTKAALLSLWTMRGFKEIVGPSVRKLMNTTPKSEVLKKALGEYLLFEPLEDAGKILESQRVFPLKKKVLKQEDYKLTKFERKVSPNKSLKIATGWVIEQNEEVGNHTFNFYPFGEPRELDFEYLSLDISKRATRILWTTFCRLEIYL